MTAKIPQWDPGLFNTDGLSHAKRGDEARAFTKNFSNKLASWLNSSGDSASAEVIPRVDIGIADGQLKLSDTAVDRFAFAMEQQNDLSEVSQALQLSLNFSDDTLFNISTETRFVKTCLIYNLDELMTMTPAADVDALMATTAAVLRNITHAVADIDATKLSPILHTAIPHLMQIPELYRTVEGKLNTEDNSLSQVVDDDEEMHTNFLQALVDLIPSVCDLELQLMAVETAVNVCARDAVAMKSFLKYLGAHSSYKPSLTKMFKGIDPSEPDCGVENFVRDMHKLSRGKFKIPTEKQMHLWDVQASFDNGDEVFEATVIVSKHEIYFTNMLTAPDDPNAIDQRWNPNQVERRLQPSNGQDAATTLILSRHQERDDVSPGNDDYVASTVALIFDDANVCDQAARTFEALCPRLSRTSTRRPSVSPFFASTSSGRVERPTLALSVTGTCTTPDPSDTDNSTIRGRNGKNGGSAHDTRQSETITGSYEQSSSKKQSIQIEDKADVREYDLDDENYDQSSSDEKATEHDDEESETHSQQMAIVRGQLSQIPVHRNDGDSSDEDVQPLFDTEDVDDVQEIRIGGKLLRSLTVAELKKELSSRLPQEEIPKPWPRKSGIIEMLESTIRTSSRAELSTAKHEGTDDETGNDDTNDAAGNADIEVKTDAITHRSQDSQLDVSDDCEDSDIPSPNDDMNCDLSESISESNADDDLDHMPVFELRGKQIKNLTVAELKQELQSRLDDGIIQDLSKPKWPRKAELVRRLELELHKEREASKKTSRQAEESEERSVLSVKSDENLFDQVAADYAQQNPQEANLAAKKSSPFGANGKQYTSRRKKQQNETRKTRSAGSSESVPVCQMKHSRSQKQLINTGNMNELLADLSETEAAGRRHKKGSSSNAACNSTDDDDLRISKDVNESSSCADRKGTKKKKKKTPLEDSSNFKANTATTQDRQQEQPTGKGVFDDIFAGELEESDNQPNKYRPQRSAAAAATVAVGAVAAAELQSSSEEEDNAEMEIHQADSFSFADGSDPMKATENSNDEQDTSDDDDDPGSNDDQQQESNAEPSDQHSSIIQDMLDNDASQDPDNDENEFGNDQIHNKVIFRNVNGVLLNQFQIPSPGVSPMENTQKKLSFLDGSDEESLSESEDEDNDHISGIMNFDEVVKPAREDNTTDFASHSGDTDDFIDDEHQEFLSGRYEGTTSQSIESQILIRSVQAKIKAVGKMRRKGQKQEAQRHSRNAQSLLSSAAAKESTKVDKLRKISLAPIHKSLKKRATAIKRAKEYLAQEYALCVATHEAEIKRLDAIANASRACAGDIEANRLESQSALKEKHDEFMSTYVSQNEGFVGKVKDMASKDPREDNIAKMMALLTASA